MNGAEAIVAALAKNGIDICFANPGTTELALVDALDRTGRIRCVLGLFEGVCTGAADGYARMLGRPAATLLHLGPGFANGIANLHNARRARSAVLNLVGDHATWHLPFDAPLASDIRSLAAPVSGHYAYVGGSPLCIDEMLQAVQASMAGAKAPIAYFGKTGLPSELVRPGTRVETLAEPGGDAEGAITALARALGAASRPARATSLPVVPDSGLRLDPSVMAQTVAALLPERAIVAVEGATTTPFFFTAAAAAKSHTVLTNTGGAIGQGMPVATGAALACPDRPVINLQGDGSAAYTMQALWTQARERLNVVTILCANKTYGVLRVELERAGIDPDASVPHRMTSLEDPALDWVGLARGFGVPAARAGTAGELTALFRTALSQGGPFLIEAVM